MHVAEFLNRTNRRNRNTQIECHVERKLGEYAEDLDRRRHLLAHQLHSEEQQLYEELAELQQAQTDLEQNKRIEWIQMALMRDEAAERELLEQKQQQREIENSEEHRHEETRQILLATKEAQLYQIEERKERRRRAAQMEAIWHQNEYKFI
ncbi:trichohyalin [Drosophila mojavensis]|uniref:Uncharacterized protein n=1 Tax=Drosophila mojavensis TaxID=7230 RepID=B4KRP0_DROMO|nr:trichohyalin [Drosophila mojavensis]EDW08310.1 uncharacterized protein Dmoj_GI19652 [Drosophila mojavensis]